MMVLVAYASRHGATEEIARFVSDRLCERGVQAEAHPMGDVTDLSRFDAVVLGSAVYAGSWMREGTAFVRTNGETLSRIPAWLFSSGPIDAESAHGVSEKQLAELEDTIHPRVHRAFAGALDVGKLGFVERKMVKMVKAPEGDFRDWDAIAAFADEITLQLA